MVFNITDTTLKKIKNYADWKLLLFLLLFLNVKLAVKIPAIVIIYLLQFNFKFGFKFKNSRLPLFYLLIIIIPFISLAVNGSYTNVNYLIVFFTGLGFALLYILAIHQVKLSVENSPSELIHKTILIFFVLNAILSAYNLTSIIFETGAINPYRYQGNYQKYFIGTGDYIKGLTFDTSTTNAVLNAIGVIYFLVRKNALMACVCMIILLLTGSNFINVALLLILVLLFAFKSNRDQKSLIIICTMFLVVFMAKVSPQNDQYVIETVKNAIHPQNPVAAVICAGIKKNDSIPTLDDIRRQVATLYLDSIRRGAVKPQVTAKKTTVNIPVLKTEQGKIYLPKPDINTKPYQTNTDTSAEQKRLLAFISINKPDLPISGTVFNRTTRPGKVIGFLQTITYLRHHLSKIVAGDGIGNFSSKLAFRATGLGFAGGYPAKHIYINSDFLRNHLDVYLNFFSKRIGLHSLTNSPFSVYDQILAEYGVLGVLAFVLFYIGFFTRHYRKLTYGLPLLLLLLAVLFIDYWFEQLSVILFFELLLLLNIKETSAKAVNYAHN
ncbi:hypothetical protein BH09BAC6_BH09BAC6_04640 [soil metagenome]|jgi:hypothetical protein